MLDAFYGAFSPACFALLGLWLVAVQLRLRDWQGSVFHLRRSYGVALHFVLPGVMSLSALIDPGDAIFWRVAFAVVAFGGVAVLMAVGRQPADEATPLTAAGSAARRLEWAPYLTAAALYVLIGALALIGGKVIARTEAFLLLALVFTGFNGAWLLLFDNARQPVSAVQADGAQAESDGVPRPAEAG
jgi:hypothetical protein